MVKEGRDGANVSVNSPENVLLAAKTSAEANPENLRLLDKYIQLLIKNNDLTEAETVIAGSELLHKDCAESGLIHAHLLYKMKKYDQADLMFDVLIEKHPANQKLRILYAQTLRKRRKIIKAYGVIKVLDVSSLDKKQAEIHDEITRVFKEVEIKEKRELQATDDFGILSMKHAILHYKQYTPQKTPKTKLGKLSLITGSLGPGGAERQLCLTAVNINEKMREGASVSGVKITKEVDVLINLWDSEEKAFFVPFLKKNKVNLYQIKDLPITPIENLGITSPQLFHLLNESPSPIRYGLNRLVEYFKEAETEVAFAWQDGAILFTALAALVAGVPRILLNFRGYPPNLRPHLFKPEYHSFYQSLAEMPQVSFVTNTKVTAQAYADWLNISIKRFTVIYNGIAPPNTHPEPEEECAWKNFVSQTSDATETIGGVFRFETDKRPLLAIRLIKRYLQKNPYARFILIGEGRLRAQCMELADDLKISHRILFIGLSKAVGYWMLKMDAMILMSRYEGLPNVLIEAQYMGVPVISTPTGGAGECFLPGETGSVLSDADDPDLFEACTMISTLIQQFKENPDLSTKAKNFAAMNFSISGMIENTVSVLTRAPFELEQPVCDVLA